MKGQSILSDKNDSKYNKLRFEKYYLRNITIIDENCKYI